jgi:uncharacterized protein with HEPN domain
MRNALAHGYFKVDLSVLWRTIEIDLPRLAAQVSELSAALKEPDLGKDKTL